MRFALRIWRRFAHFFLLFLNFRLSLPTQIVGMNIHECLALLVSDIFQDDTRMCSLYNNILTPGKLEPKADLYLFIEGIKPDWEEKETASGGSWTASVPRNMRMPKELLDQWWHDSVSTFIPARAFNQALFEMVHECCSSVGCTHQLVLEFVRFLDKPTFCFHL